MSILAAVAAVAGTAVNIGMAVKASKEAEAQRKKQEAGLAGQKSMANISAMKTADLAGQGGLSAGQYNRGLQQNDVYAQQVEGLVNRTESESVFGNAYKNQAMAKLALNDIGKYTRKTAQGLQDLDVSMTVQNAQLAIEGAAKTANIEANITRQENAMAEQELAHKQAIQQNVAKGIASTAALVGASVKYSQMQQNQNTLKTGGTGIQAGLESSDNSVFGEVAGVDYNKGYNYSGRSTPSIVGGAEAHANGLPQYQEKTLTLYDKLMGMSDAEMQAYLDNDLTGPFSF